MVQLSDLLRSEMPHHLAIIFPGSSVAACSMQVRNHFYNFAFFNSNSTLRLDELTASVMLLILTFVIKESRICNDLPEDIRSESASTFKNYAHVLTFFFIFGALLLVYCYLPIN